MGLIETASGNSVWRGMDYYENKKVVSFKKLICNDLLSSRNYQETTTIFI